jgi:transposase
MSWGWGPRTGRPPPEGVRVDYPRPTAFLGDFRGYLQADAYAAYDGLYATGRIIEVGCMAHARRHFWDAKASDSPRALLALGFIQKPDVVERAAKAWDAAAPPVGPITAT